MTMTVWRIFCLASMVLFVAGVIALFVTRLLKNVYYHNFTQDELMRDAKTTNSRNAIYFTSGETKKYIKKYVVCKTAYDKYLVCNYAKSFSSVKFFVVEYTAHRRVLAVQQIVERQTGDASKVIALHRRCKYVNVVIGSVEGLEVNADVIRPLSLAKIRLYAFLKSFTIFLGLFVARHFLIELIVKNGAKYFMADFLNYIAIGGSLLLGLLSYFITVKCFRHRNTKAQSGGALEYEFL